MTTFTDKELIKEIRERIGSLDVRDNIERVLMKLRWHRWQQYRMNEQPMNYLWRSVSGNL